MKGGSDGRRGEGNEPDCQQENRAQNTEQLLHRNIGCRGEEQRRENQKTHDVRWDLDRGHSGQQADQQPGDDQQRRRRRADSPRNRRDEDRQRH